MFRLGQILDQLSPVEQSYIAGVLVEKAIVSSWDIEVGLRYIRYYSLREEKLPSYSGVKKNLYSDPQLRTRAPRAGIPQHGIQLS